MGTSRCTVGGPKASVKEIPAPTPSPEDLPRPCGAVAEKNTTTLLARAFQGLKPVGLLLVHGFMVENDRTGPTSPALWLLTSVLMDVDAPLLTSERRQKRRRGTTLVPWLPLGHFGPATS